MRRYPPSTTYIYLELPSIQIIQTHNSHIHITTPPFQPPIHSPPTPPTAAHPKHKHTSNTPPCSHRIGKAEIQSSYPFTSYTPPRLNTYTFQTVHQLLIQCTTLIPCTSAVPDTIPQPRVPPTHSRPAFTTITPPSPTPASPSSSHPHTLSA